jgi:tetratricopeptide (TPR) repeat protein
MNWKRAANGHRALTFHPLHALVVLFASVFVLGVVFGALARPARADDAEGEARRHFNNGKRLYDGGQYREAADEFEAGYAILPKSGFLINIGHCYRRAGDLKRAKRYYELFLEKDSRSPQRQEVEAYIRSLTAALADQGQQSEGDQADADGGGARDQASLAAPRLPAPERVHVDAEARGTASGDSAHPIWPWLVSGAAVVIAGGIAAALVISRAGKGGDCGTLGCLNER